MDEVNINKYLSQINPILVVPVLSAVVGAILVFVFGFKRPNEPRFQTANAIEALKKPKRKLNTTKSSENVVQSSRQQNASSAKLNVGKKATEPTVAAPSKKGTANEKPSNNNNNTNSTNNNVNKKKTDEKKSENGSPSKKVANKKIDAVPASKKSKANKNASTEEQRYNERPADFDDGGWFTVQSKSAKQKNKVDDSAVNQTENSSPKVQAAKINKAAKTVKAEPKPRTAQPVAATVASATELNNDTDDLVIEPSNVEVKKNETTLDALVAVAVAAPVIVDEPVIVPVNGDQVIEEVKPAVSAQIQTAADVNAIVENAIAFDELGEWTDAKPDRKRGNKKKSRKD